MADEGGFLTLLAGWLIDAGLMRRNSGVARYFKVLSGVLLWIAILLLVFLTICYS